jgi:hypothetical protein
MDNIEQSNESISKAEFSNESQVQEKKYQD